MATVGLFSLLLIPLFTLFGLDATDPGDILQMIYNALGTAIGFLILGILALIYLLGLIPNPFPWML